MTPRTPHQSTDIGALLRQEVARLRGHESRRRFDTAVHLGVPGGPRARFVVRAQDAPIMDAGLRADVVARLLDDTPDDHRWGWLTRAGEPHLHDLDLEWLSSVSRAFGTHGRALTGFYAVTRSGWLDVRTGESRSWRRLRL